MLTQLDLDRRLDKAAYKEKLDPLMIELQGLHRRIFEKKIPVLLLFDGWEGAGKGDAINRLLSRLDPRGVRVAAFEPPTEEEALRPFFWRFWRRLPSRGQVAVFEQPYTYWRIHDRIHGELKGEAWQSALRSVRHFEDTLADDGVLILKFWFQMDRKEQRKRLKKWEDDPAFAFRANKEAWRENKHYDERLKVAEEVLSATHTKSAPWIVVESHDRRYRRLRVVEEVCAAFRRAAAGSAPKTSAGPSKSGDVRVTKGKSPLASLGRRKPLSRAAYENRLDAAQDELRELQHLCYVERRPVVFAFEGSDAAGKGGAIRRLTAPLDPRGYDVIPVAAPEGEEKHKHYLWRFWRDVPKAGHWAIYDRSWYGRVLVERVEKFARPEEWLRAYGEIRDFERQLVEAGAVVLKFWLQIGPAEQLKRFRARQRTPHKRHKITDEDWRNRKKRPEYERAVADMLIETSRPKSPWVVVPAEDKYAARVAVVETAAAAVRRHLKRRKK